MEGERSSSGAPRRVVIVGGGIVGLTAALELARRGASAVVLERDVPGRGASSGNAGIVALGHPPLPSPGLIGKTLRLLFRPTNPLYMPPRFDPSLWRFMLEFRRACRPAHYDRSVALLARLGWEAGRAMNDLVGGGGIDCEYSRTGWLEVFRTSSGFDHGRRVADKLRPFGYTIVELDGPALREREPAYRDGVVGALHYADSAFAHPGKLMAGLAARCDASGVERIDGTEVTRIDLDGGRFRAVETADGRRFEGDRLVLAAGAWTTALARQIGVDVPMQAGKGYHVELASTPHRPSTTCVLAETFVAVTPLGGGLRLAGTVELSGVNLRMVRRRLEMLPIGARAYIRGIDEARVESSWCGLRPLTADGLPVVGWAPGLEGVFVATGHAMYGFLFGPLTGRIVAEALLDGRTSVDVSAMGPDRFARRR